MDLKNFYFLQDTEAVRETETNIGISIPERFNNEPDFIEHYEDADGILRIRTFFNHNDIAEHDLWEVFVPENSACALELLLNNN